MSIKLMYVLPFLFEKEGEKKVFLYTYSLWRVEKTLKHSLYGEIVFH